jgi:predicted branched-subunit amino acid permease
MAETSADPVRRAARDGIALGLAVGTSGLAFGAAAVASGLSPAQACVLSLVAYTGASQFALATAVAGGGNLIAGTASAVLLGSRNGLYGLRLAGLLDFRGPFRLLAALGITDESTAVALAQPAGGRTGRAAVRAGFLATFGSLYLTWNAGTLAGALGAGRLGSPSTFGLDVVGPAAFLALLWPRLREGRTERTVALAGALIALAATPFCPPGLPIVLAAAAALGAALLPSAGTLPPAGQAALSPAGAAGPAAPGAAGPAAPGQAVLSDAEGTAACGRPDPAGAAGAAGGRPCR